MLQTPHPTHTQIQPIITPECVHGAIAAEAPKLCMDVTCACGDPYWPETQTKPWNTPEIRAKETFYLCQNCRETGCWIGDRASRDKGKAQLPVPSAHLAAKQGSATGKPRPKPRGASSPKAERGTRAAAGRFGGAVWKRLWQGRSRRDRLTGCAGKAALPAFGHSRLPGSARMRDFPVWDSPCLLGHRQERGRRG